MTFSNREHYMTEVVSNIELRFGPPSSQDKEELANKRAIEFDVSVERILLDDFEYLLTNVWMKKTGKIYLNYLFLFMQGRLLSVHM